MIVFTITLDPEIISDPDLFQQIISDPGGFEYGPTTPKSLVGVLVLNPNMTQRKTVAKYDNQPLPVPVPMYHTTSTSNRFIKPKL